MTKTIPIFGVVLLLAVALGVAAYWALVPGRGCSSVEASEFWSADRAYKATLLRNECSTAFGGETLFWKLRVDKPEATGSGGWFMVWEIEDDESFASVPPAVRWDDSRVLKVDVSTKRLRGELTSEVDDLIVVRTFSPVADGRRGSVPIAATVRATG